MSSPDQSTDPIKPIKFEEETPSKIQQRIISQTTGLYHLKLSSKNESSDDQENDDQDGNKVSLEGTNDKSLVATPSLSPKRSILNIRASSFKSNKGGKNRLSFYDDLNSNNLERSTSNSSFTRESPNPLSRRSSFSNNNLLSASGKKNMSASPSSVKNTKSTRELDLLKPEVTLESMLLELAAKERKVVELENELTLARKQLKEFENECKLKMEAQGMIPNSKSPNNDLISKWTNKLKETTDEFLQINTGPNNGDNGYTNNQEVQPDHRGSRESGGSSGLGNSATSARSPKRSGNQETLKSKQSFLQLGLSKVSNILGEFYEDVEEELDFGSHKGSTSVSATPKKKNIAGATRNGSNIQGSDSEVGSQEETISKSSPYYNRSVSLFDKLKTKINEFTLYEEEEEEYDKVKDKKLDRMVIVDDFQDCSIVTTDMEDDTRDLEDEQDDGTSRPHGMEGVQLI